MKRRDTNSTHKGWTIYKAGPFPGFFKRYYVYPPDAPPGERFVEPSLLRAKQLINGLLSLEVFKARLKEEAEWIEIEE